MNKKDITIESHFKREYSSWSHMKERCYSQNCNVYNYYGAKGIKVCDKWLNDFMAFYRDMGIRPKGYTLHRIDSSKDYEPSNCKWATWSEQNHEKKIPSNNKSGIKGVSWNKQRQAWKAYISINKKIKHLGYYTNLDDAQEARYKAEASLVFN